MEWTKSIAVELETGEREEEELERITNKLEEDTNNLLDSERE